MKKLVALIVLFGLSAVSGFCGHIKFWEDCATNGAITRLRWMTNATTEIQIDRSIDSNSWETIGFVWSPALITNVFIDYAPTPNHYYYRVSGSFYRHFLKQPVSRSASQGATVSLTCLAFGKHQTYQWYFQNGDWQIRLDGYTRPTLTFNRHFSGFQFPYFCVVDGCMTSKVARVTYYGNPKQLAVPSIDDRCLTFKVTAASGDFQKTGKFTLTSFVDGPFVSANFYSIVGSTYLPPVGWDAYISEWTGKDGSMQINQSTWVELHFKSRSAGTFVLTDEIKSGSQSGTFTLK